MIIFTRRRYTTAVRVVKDTTLQLEQSLSEDKTLSPAEFDALLSRMLETYKGFRVRNLVKRAMKKGKFTWNTSTISRGK